MGNKKQNFQLREWVPRFSHLHDIHSREVVRGASFALFLRVLAAVFGFVLNVLLARTLGADGAGLYFLCLTFVIIFAALGSMGMSSAVMKLTAIAKSAGEGDTIVGVYRRAMTTVLMATSLLTFILIFLSPVLASGLYEKPEMGELLMIMSAAIVPLALLTVQAQALRGMRRIVASFCTQSIYTPIIMCVGVAIFARRFGLDAVVWIYFLANGVALIIGFLHWHNSILHQGQGSSIDGRKLWSTSLSMYPVEVLKTLLFWLPLILLGLWVEASEIGVYSISSRTAMLMSFILVALNSISAPKFAVLYEQEKHRELRQLVQYTTNIKTLFACAILLVFLLFSADILAIFGPQFIAGAHLLVILACAQCVLVGLGSAEMVLMMTGHQCSVRNIYLLSCLLSITISVSLIPLYGTTGAAVAVLVVSVLQSAMTIVSARRHLGLTIVPFLPLGSGTTHSKL